jgi:hypothetical protein
MAGTKRSENLTQSRLRPFPPLATSAKAAKQTSPLNPTSYVGQGRKEKIGERPALSISASSMQAS